MKHEFQIVKKIAKIPAASAGIRISSGFSDGESFAQLSAATGGKEGNDRIRQLAESRMVSSGCSIVCKAKGKSMTVDFTGAKPVYEMMLFLSSLNPVNDEMAEAADFYLNCFGLSFDPAVFRCRELTVLSSSLSEDVFSLSLSCTPEDGADADAVYDSLSPWLEKHSMGILK